MPINGEGITAGITCAYCGDILPDDESLQKHYDDIHIDHIKEVAKREEERAKLRE